MMDFLIENKGFKSFYWIESRDADDYFQASLSQRDPSIVNTSMNDWCGASKVKKGQE